MRPSTSVERQSYQRHGIRKTTPDAVTAPSAPEPSPEYRKFSAVTVTAEKLDRVGDISAPRRNICAVTGTTEKSSRSNRPREKHTERDAREISQDVEWIARTRGQQPTLHHLAHDGVPREDAHHDGRPEAGEQCQRRRHEEHEHVHDLVRVDERRHTIRLRRCIEHGELGHDGQPEQPQQRGPPAGGPVNALAHAPSRAATAARTASATTVLTSGWNTLGMM